MTKQLLTLAFFLMICSVFALYVNLGRAQPEAPSVIFNIQVYDIDRLSRTAELNITLTFENLVGQEVAENEPVRVKLIGSSDIKEILGNKGSLTNEYFGSSGLMNWSLGGPIGRGEYYPFEENQMMFQIANVLPGPFNISKLKIDSKQSDVYLAGSKTAILNETYATKRVFSLDFSIEGDQKVVVPLHRRAESFLFEPEFWLLIAPAIASYYLLAFSLCSSGENINRRFTIYVAIFIFSANFMMAIQSRLPIRATLAIPEVLLVNLMLSTAFLAICSFLPRPRDYLDLLSDLIGLFVSYYLAWFLFLILTPIFPAKALWVFCLTIFSYASGWVILLFKHIYQFFSRQSNIVYTIKGGKMNKDFQKKPALRFLGEFTIILFLFLVPSLLSNSFALSLDLVIVVIVLFLLILSYIRQKEQ